MIFPHSITLIPVSIVDSEFSSIAKIYGEGVPYVAFVQERTESTDVINQTASSRKMAAIYVSGRCDANPLDRIVHDGKTWEVIGAALQRSTTGVHHTKIMAQELPE